MDNWHDVILMCATAGGIYGSIRFDLKFIRYRMQQLENAFKSHLDKYHGEK